MSDRASAGIGALADLDRTIIDRVKGLLKSSGWTEQGFDIAHLIGRGSLPAGLVLDCWSKTVKVENPASLLRPVLQDETLKAVWVLAAVAPVGGACVVDIHASQGTGVSLTGGAGISIPAGTGISLQTVLPTASWITALGGYTAVWLEVVSIPTTAPVGVTVALLWDAPLTLGRT